jgi:NADH-quinone oxidoreductase subunit H
MKFALFFMAEYEKMIVISMIAATLYFGGYREFWFLQGTILSVDATWSLGPWTITNWFLGPLYLFLKVVVLLFFMIWIRATWPRIRYDRLMALGWKVLLPLSIAVVVITAFGVLLADELGPIYLWTVPVLSVLAGLVTAFLLNLSLQRKVAHV